MPAFTGGKPLCAHCKKSKVNRPRGLCWHCYYTPGVRLLYPSTSKYAKRSPVPSVSASPLPKRPTRLPKGHPRRIVVMAARAMRGEATYHPQDCAEFA